MGTGGTAFGIGARRPSPPSVALAVAWPGEHQAEQAGEAAATFEPCALVVSRRCSMRRRCRQSPSGSDRGFGRSPPWARRTSPQAKAPGGRLSARVTTIGMPAAVSARSVRRTRRSPSAEDHLERRVPGVVDLLAHPPGVHAYHGHAHGDAGPVDQNPLGVVAHGDRNLVAARRRRATPARTPMAAPGRCASKAVIRSSMVDRGTRGRRTGAEASQRSRTVFGYVLVVERIVTLAHGDGLDLERRASAVSSAPGLSSVPCSARISPTMACGDS